MAKSVANNPPAEGWAGSTNSLGPMTIIRAMRNLGRQVGIIHVEFYLLSLGDHADNAQTQQDQNSCLLDAPLSRQLGKKVYHRYIRLFTMWQRTHGYVDGTLFLLSCRDV
eukprot:scaffold27129_cov73-Attheya_sp.AAC.7